VRHYVFTSCIWCKEPPGERSITATTGKSIF
jgi:hypothetical protein